MTPRERAERLEYEAERTGDLDTWAVASDAWLETGDMQRAWYARLRSREPYGTSVPRLLRRSEAEAVARAFAPSNEARGALELFEFMGP